MIQNRPYYRLEQLANMGLSEQIFIPALLQELHHIIPSLANSFCWQDDKGNLSNIYDESLNTDVINKFLLAMSNTSEDKYSYTTKWVSTLNKITTTHKYYKKCPHVVEFYKTILLPLGYRNSCFIPIISSDSNQRIGVLMIHRGKGDNNFTTDEIEALSSITNIIAAGCRCTPSHIDYKLNGWEQGILITDPAGQVEYGCKLGLKLLAMASTSQFNSKIKKIESNVTCFPSFENLITSLLAQKNHIRNEIDPTLSLCNAWGEFQLRACLIDDIEGRRSSQIGFTICLQEPFNLKLFHRIKTLNLTPRQESIALFYAAGDSLQIIADKLSISLYTVKEHIKNTTDRLEIKSRADLIALILCEKAFL